MDTKKESEEAPQHASVEEFAVERQRTGKVPCLPIKKSVSCFGFEETERNKTARQGCKKKQLKVTNRFLADIVVAKSRRSLTGV